MSQSARFVLKAATADAHDRVDALFSRFDLADPGDYGRFLQAQAGAFLGVEAALDAAGAERVLTDWVQRRRTQAVRDDLSVLGIPLPDAAPVPELIGDAAILGAVYVLEGSRLGGAMLVRTVPDTLPRSFLTPGNPLLWRAFVAILDERLSSEDERADAAKTASAVFDIFATSARHHLGVDRL